MEISVSQTVGGSFARVMDILSGGELGRARIKYFGADKYADFIPVAGTEPKCTETRFLVPADRLPAAAAAFIGLPHVQGSIRISYFPSGKIDFAPELPGLPLTLQLSGQVTQVGENVTSVRYTGKAEVRVPFAGRAVEAKIVSVLQGALRHEERLIEELAGNGTENKETDNDRD